MGGGSRKAMSMVPREAPAGHTQPMRLVGRRAAVAEVAEVVTLANSKCRSMHVQVNQCSRAVRERRRVMMHM